MKRDDVFDAPGNRAIVLVPSFPGPRLHALMPTSGAETWVPLAEAGTMMSLQSITIDTARHRLLGIDYSLGVAEDIAGGDRI